MSNYSTNPSWTNVHGEWFPACREIVTRQAFVTIDLGKLDKIVETVNAYADFGHWRDYVSAEAAQGSDLTRLAFEMLVTVSNIGGYIYLDANGQAQKWEKDGSGSKALFEKLQSIREKSLLPLIDIPPEDIAGKIGPLIADMPYAEHRLKAFRELAQPQSRANLEGLLASATTDDGYHFTYQHTTELARIFPDAFGGDTFTKKATLFFLTLSLAFNDLNIKTTTATIVPGEYRLPQIFEAHEVLSYHPDLERKITARQPLDVNSGKVVSIRAAAILIAGEISARTGKSNEQVDGALYMLTRNPDFMANAKPHMMVPTWLF